MKKIKEVKYKKIRLGSAAQKILLLLQGGLALGLTQRPDTYFRIIRGITKEWQDINKRTLHEAIKKLYQSKLIDYKENDDGTVDLVLNDDGKKRALKYNLDTIKIKKSAKWDGLWRVIIFDIPECFKQGRDALAVKLKQMGFYPLQKSVFIYPYECKNEIDFIIEIFDLRQYVRIMLVKETDVDLDLKNKFKIR
jgi:DNA-binding transcriptional regulator PaaX